MDSACKAFFKKFTSLYGKVFEKHFGYGKIKNNKKIVDKKGNSKIFENKAKTCDKFLKSKTDECEKSFKIYRKLFESTKQSAKSQCYSKVVTSLQRKHTENLANYEGRDW